MLRISNNLPLLASAISTMATAKAAVLRNLSFRKVSSRLVSNTLKNSTNELISLKSSNNNILTLLRSKYQHQAFINVKDTTRQRTILRLSSLMSSRNSFQSPKKLFTFNTDFLHSKKNSHLRNSSTSISSSAKGSSPKVSSVEDSVAEGKSMTEKFKILTKKYGVSAMAVYLAITALDLGLTFILIQICGTDRVKKVEDWFRERFGNWIVLRKDPTSNTNTPKTDNTGDVNDNGNRANQTPSWASTFVIAYGIHKLLVPFRLGLTAAITPAIVRKLKRMGWNIGGKHL